LICIVSLFIFAFEGYKLGVFRIPDTKVKLFMKHQFPKDATTKVINKKKTTYCE